MKKDLLDLRELSKEEINNLIKSAENMKKNPLGYSEILKNKTLLMMFEKPSLRTRVSFEVGMTQLGGHAIYYDISTSPMGKKESIADTAKTASRYADIIMARLFKHSDIKELAENSSIPVINALTDSHHPCQILADLLTIKEKKGSLNGLKIAYFGDGNNNVTHSLLLGCAICGINVSIACPESDNFKPDTEILEISKKISEKSGAKIILTHEIKQAAESADVIYTDSWMSYHIPENTKEERIKLLDQYQVTEEIINYAKEDCIFMHCLPAMRGVEVTSEVIDGNKSVVFEQAENRLHMQKALMLKLLGVN